MTIREDIKNHSPVPVLGYSIFNLHKCNACGNTQRYPLTERLIHRVECNKCGKLHTFTFILGDK